MNAVWRNGCKLTTKGAIVMLNGTAPYGIEKRAMPSGLDLDALLPETGRTVHACQH